MQRYAGKAFPGDADLGMDVQEMLNYLRSMDYQKHAPLEGILVQTEAIGDPAQPTREQTAILKWLGAAMGEWELRFPLEEPLAGQLRRLKPLLAAVAVTESSFLTPGAHPLHRLLDTIQLHAIGWQPRLGRVGQVLEEQVGSVVDRALTWFDRPTTDLAAISADMAAMTARALGRANKMAQRMIETEQGRIRVEQSKQQAALMINAALEEYAAPAQFGEFLRGPWYDSAQLVLLKYGGSSSEWQNMSLTTTRLLQSLQAPATGEDEAGHRERLYKSVSPLAGDLSRWLLSLQHDREAIRDAVTLLESYHAKLLRKQALTLQKISPIPLEDHERDGQRSQESMNQLREGQWFLLDTDKSVALRATLVLRMESEQQLLFSNQAGIRVLQKSFAEFSRLWAQGRVTLLDTGASFSRCLARSAGVETQDDLDELTGVTAERARLKEERRQEAEQERARLAHEQAERERAELERQFRKQERLAQLQREQEAAERLRQEQEDARRRRQEAVELDRQHLLQEQAEALRLQKKWEEVTRRHCEQWKSAIGYSSSKKEKDPEPAPTDLNLPRGTWLGFRDGDPPILAKLAVYHRERNEYVFVDRHGIRMRQLSGKELLIMLARGIADILEARSRFRDEVTRIQEQTAD